MPNSPDFDRYLIREGFKTTRLTFNLAFYGTIVLITAALVTKILSH